VIEIKKAHAPARLRAVVAAGRALMLAGRIDRAMSFHRKDQRA
jgi:hypothetical protein